MKICSFLFDKYSFSIHMRFQSNDNDKETRDLQLIFTNVFYELIMFDTIAYYGSIFHRK